MVVSLESGRVLAVVFDAVGTLIDPDPPVAVAYAQAAERQGVRLEVSEVRARFTTAFAADESDEARGPMSTSEAIESRRWRRIVHAVLPEVPDPDRAFEELWAHFAAPGSWHWFEDVLPALTQLERAGIALRVGSNFDGRLRDVLRGLGPLSRLADTAVISSEVGYRKPHQAFYRAACEAVGLEPSRVLFIGDDPTNDVAGPREAGMQALLLDRRRRQDPAHPRLFDLHTLAPRLLG